jgi:hypothetical protein
LRVASRSLPVLVIRFGFLVAFVAAFVPAVIVVAVVMVAAFLAASPLTVAGFRWKEFGLAAAIAVVAPVSLHAPWSYDVLGSFSWRWLIGPQSPEVSIDGFLDLLLFAPGRPALNLLGLGFIASAVVGLMVARGQQLGAATQGWLVALAMFGLLWAARRGWLPFDLPSAEIMLAPALAALSFVVAIGVRSLELDTGRRPIARRAAYVASAAGLVAGSLGAVVMSFNGRWDAPTQNYAAFTEFLAANADDESEGEAPGRVLWIGDASVMPIDVAVSRTGVQYAMTSSGTPEVWGRWSAGPVGATAGVGQQLDLARTGETVRLGRLLAPYGVDLVVVVDQLAPAPYEGPTVDPGGGVLNSLTQQLDLERIPGVPNLIVFSNASSNGIASVLPSAEAAEAVTSADQLNVDLTAGPTVPLEPTGVGEWLLDVPGDVPVLLSVPSDGLTVNGQRDQLIEGFDGLSVIPSTISGQAEIAYPIPLRRRIGLGVQLLVVAFGAILAQTRREVQA